MQIIAEWPFRLRRLIFLVGGWSGIDITLPLTLNLNLATNQAQTGKNRTRSAALPLSHRPRTLITRNTIEKVYQIDIYSILTRRIHNIGAMSTYVLTASERNKLWFWLFCVRPPHRDFTVSTHTVVVPWRVSLYHALSTHC